MMVSINAAYEILSDNEKRKQYHNLCSDESKSNYHNNTSSKSYSYGNGYANNQSSQGEEHSSTEAHSYAYDSKRRYKVSVWWQMLFAVIPIVNCWAFYRIERSF